MAEKRVSVRLAAVGGRQVRAELEGVGDAGSRGIGRLSREMEVANARLAAFSRRVRVAAAAVAVADRRRRGYDPLRFADGRCAGQSAVAAEPPLHKAEIRVAETEWLRNIAADMKARVIEIDAA